MSKKHEVFPWLKIPDQVPSKSVSVEGEKAGYREAIDRRTKQLIDSGADVEYAKKQARKGAITYDRMQRNKDK